MNDTDRPATVSGIGKHKPSKMPAPLTETERAELARQRGADTDRPATVADACRGVAARTRDQQAQDVLFQAARELDRLTADLAQHQPEERVGRCGCEEGEGWTYGVLAGDNLICTDFDGCKQSGCPMTNDEGDGPYCGSDNPKPEWLAAVDPDWGIDAWGELRPRFCPDCGWELDHETGFARRNADTARVQRVREALHKHRALLCTDAECDRSARTIAATIRAALDGQDNEEVTV